MKKVKSAASKAGKSYSHKGGLQASIQAPKSGINVKAVHAKAKRLSGQ